MKRAIIVCILLGFGLAGCGGSSTSSSVAPTDVSSVSSESPIQKQNVVVSHKLQDYYYITDIRMPNGKTLVCIEAYEYTDGGPGLSCNWDAYNKKGY